MSSEVTDLRETLRRLADKAPEATLHVSDWMSGAISVESPREMRALAKSLEILSVMFETAALLKEQQS